MTDESWVVLLGSRTQGYGTAKPVGPFPSVEAARAWVNVQPADVQEKVLGAVPLVKPDED